MAIPPNQWAMTMLKSILPAIEKNDPSSFTYAGTEEEKEEAYAIRNDMIYKAVHYARMAFLTAGFKIHTPVSEIVENGWDEKWGVVAYIVLPTGQVSWHIEAPDVSFDGHTYEDKHERISKFMQD